MQGAVGEWSCGGGGGGGVEKDAAGARTEGASSHLRVVESGQLSREQD